MSIPSWELTAEIVKYWKAFNGDLGVPRMYIESATSEGGNGGKSRIAAYAAVRALWDDSQTADEHLRDFCRVGFGPGAAAMLAYYRACSAAWTNQAAHLTGTFNNPLGTAKSYFTPALQKLGETAFATARKALDDALAAAGGDPIRRNLAQKQLATLAFEKACFDEWKALRVKAISTSMQINLELDEDVATAFDRMPKLPLKVRNAWEGEDVTHSTSQFFRTREAIHVRITTRGPVFKPKAWKIDRSDNSKAYGADSVECFIQAPRQSVYYQLAVSSEGYCYDGKCLDGGWNSDLWIPASRQADNFWELTLTIPYKLFGDIEVKGGEVFKFIAISNSEKLNEKQEPQRFAVGLPFPAYHDMAIGVDLLIDDHAGRRAAGE